MQMMLADKNWKLVKEYFINGNKCSSCDGDCDSCPGKKAYENLEFAFGGYDYNPFQKRTRSKSAINYRQRLRKVESLLDDMKELTEKIGDVIDGNYDSNDCSDATDCIDSDDYFAEEGIEKWDETLTR